MYEKGAHSWRAGVKEAAELLVLSAELVVKIDWGISRKLVWIWLQAAWFTIASGPDLEVGPALNGVWIRSSPEVLSNLDCYVLLWFLIGTAI